MPKIVTPHPPAVADEVLKMAGILMQNAACNEALMFAAFTILSRCPANIARSIFHALDTFYGKKVLLNRLLDVVGDEDKKLVGMIIAAAEKSNNQRREVAHSFLTWESLDDNATPKILHPKSNRHEKVSPDMIETYLRHSREAFSEGGRAIEKLAQKHKAPSLLFG